MLKKSIYCAGSTPAIRYAEQILISMGFPISSDCNWNTGHLLLDIPSFQNSVTLRAGGNIDTLLNSLPNDIIIWGGNLSSPATESYQTVDLLKDELYLAKNAAITADCAVQIAAPLLTTTWQDTSALVIGWGRIGKCLSKLLKDIGCNVTVMARNRVSQCALQSLGYNTIDPGDMTGDVQQYRILFNTVPETVISEADAQYWSSCIKIDLASKKGVAGDNVVWARGLPGIHAPESSGKLIAETFSRLWKELNL